MILDRVRKFLLLLLSQLQDRAWMILLIAIGCGMITQAVREGIGWSKVGTGLEWGVGVVVFGTLTLMIRSKVK